MRLVRSVVLLFLAALFALPGEVVKNIVVDWISKALLNTFNIELPAADYIVSYIWYLAPFAAAVAVLYLYGRYIEWDAAKRRPVREMGISLNLKDGAALLFLTVFVLSTLIFGYKERLYSTPTVPKQNSDLHRLADYELRKRAFQVSEKLQVLDRQYSERQKEINAQYEKQREEYVKAQAEYEQERNKAYTLEPKNLGSILSIPTYSLNVAPLNVTSPPRAPEYPIVSVEATWLKEVEKVQAEAAVVWEELHHRMGTYPPFFTIPKNYNPNTQSVSYYGKLLEDTANKLH